MKNLAYEEWAELEEVDPEPRKKHKKPREKWQKDQKNDRKGHRDNPRRKVEEDF